MTGNRFETAKHPRDWTGQQAIRLHREHMEKLGRDRALAEAIAAERSAELSAESDAVAGGWGGTQDAEEDDE